MMASTLTIVAAAVGLFPWVTPNRHRTYEDRHVQLFDFATPYFGLTMVQS